MSTTVTYKGSTLTTVDNQTRTLKTAGKYMEGDVILVDVTESGSGSGVVWQDGQGYIHLSDEGDIELQTKTVTPTETAQTITADAGYYALEKVNVGAISNTYVGTGITRRSSSDLTASGATVTVPSGYYSAQASMAVASGTKGTLSKTHNKTDSTFTTTFSYPNATEGYYNQASMRQSMQDILTIQNETVTPSTSAQVVNVRGNLYYLNSVTVEAMPSGTEGTPTATKGTVSNHSVTVTPSVTNSAGYISGGTKTGTTVSVSASELVSGTLPVTQNGTADVTNYASVNVTVPSGEDIPVFTINLSTNPPTATCNKTFAECETLLNANNTNAIAYAPSVPTKVPMAVHNYVSNYEIVYAIYDAYGYPMADIAYFNDGTVSYYEPSTLNNSLPTQPSSTHTGTLKATIDRSTSEKYLNIAKGYYSSDAYYTLSAVPNGTAGTPSATKGTVSNHSVSVTPSVTNTTGYITGSTKTGTAVTVTASELVSGSKSITANGTGIDVTNYASVDVSVSGSITPVTVTVTTSRRGDIIVGPLYKDLEDSDNPAIGYSLATGSWASSGLPFRILFDSNFSNQIIYISTSSATITAGNNVEVGETWTLGNCTCQNLYIQGDNAAFIVR